MSNRIKNLPRLEAKSGRRMFPEIRNGGECDSVLRPIPPEVRYPVVESYYNFIGGGGEAGAKMVS